MDESSTSLAMRLCRPSCRSLRDLFFVVLAVGMLSVLATYHLSKHLPPRQATELEIQIRGHVGIYRHIAGPPGVIGDLRYRQLHPVAKDNRHGLEGIDVEDWEKRMRERRKRKDGHVRHQLDPELLHKLKQLDDELLPPATNQKIAVIEGVDDVLLGQQRALFEEPLSKAGYSTIFIASSKNEGNNTNQPGLSSYNDSHHHGYSRQVWDTGWSLGLCAYALDPERVQDAGSSSSSSSSHQCQSINIYNLQPFQKFSIIPALYSMFISKQQFCRTMSAIRYIPALLGSPLSPLCYLLPTQYEEFLTQADVRGPGTYWVLKPLENGSTPVQLVEPTSERDYLKIKRLSECLTLVQEYLPSPLSLFGLPFSVTVYVLVTSWLPLRAHIHSQGIVHFRHDYQHNFRKVPGRIWKLDQWLHHVAESHTQKVADVAETNMEIVIVETLLATETLAYHDQQINIMLERKLKRCTSCFQLLSFELIFNSTFYPSVINIESDPDLSDSIHLDSWSDGTVNSHLIRDLVTMVTSSTPVVTDVAMALEELNLESEMNFNQTCSGQSTLRSCLLPGDIQYWLSLRRESLQKGSFRMLYPTIDADKYNHFISTLVKYTRHRHRRHGPELPDKELLTHSTAVLHQLTVSFMRYLQNVERMEESYDDLNVPWFSDSQPQNEGLNKNLLQNVYLKESNTGNKNVKRDCVDDHNELPFLEGIYTEPALDMSPAFNKSVTDYYATVPYDVYLVKVWALTISCFSEARLEDKYGLSRPSNFTLGLGNNKINIVVVDVRHSDPWAINVYTVSVYRQQVGEGLLSADQGQPHTVCSLIQDCGLHYIPSEPCGLQQSMYSSWQQYLKHASLLPTCQRGDEPGEWLVPCRSCNQSDLCSWSSAVWQPNHCVHKVLHRNSLKQCLAQKQILFIGDSTNRGIMHHLMEQVNDTLTEWDKTHNIKIYTNINRDRTTVSFAYYPQFWLPVNQRPVFDKALLALMQQSGPLQNNHNTVLVVGGVHWLATHHLKVITQTLHRQGLNRIRVIVKGLGAGFHQAVDGLHCLTLAEQRKLVLHNAGVIEFARGHGFDVVDTFNMTMARYKDFLQGKCACHFHRVREVLPSFTQYMRSTGQSGSTKLSDMPILYHVEGDINAEYSEILINRICEDNQTHH